MNALVTESGALALNIAQQNIKMIFVGSYASLGDMVWMCHALTAFRLNFSDAVIKIEDLDLPNWVGHTLIAPELRIQKDKFIGTHWDFKAHDLWGMPYYQFKGQSQQNKTEWANEFEMYRKSQHKPSMHVLDSFYTRFQEIFLGFQRPQAPIMPDIKPYHAFPPSIYTRPIVTIQTGTSKNEKTYPIEKWEIVAHELVAHGFSVVYLGTSKDPQPKYTDDWIINMIGQGDLRDTIAMIRANAVHLAGDTGTGHLAAAYRVPVVSLFGGHSYPIACKPYGDDHIIQVIEKFKSLKSPQPNMPPSMIVKAAIDLHQANWGRHKKLAIQLTL